VTRDVSTDPGRRSGHDVDPTSERRALNVESRIHRWPEIGRRFLGQGVEGTEAIDEGGGNPKQMPRDGGEVVRIGDVVTSTDLPDTRHQHHPRWRRCH